MSNYSTPYHARAATILSILAALVGAAIAAAQIVPPKVTPETMKFWSFQPVKRPAVPTAKNAAWAHNPIDAFVLSKLEARGLKPNPPASRAALIRRGYYDMLGLPPSPDDVAAFVHDPSPNAWEKLVDRLLASPHYGEKWGRHWLDLVRYAETNSYERDGPKPHVWRYRDYVIDSLNRDKPYDQFLMEQLAGDELPERTPERLIATGYYRLGIWDDEPSDPQQALYDDLDDIASTTGQAMLGLTINCARCHDHKIDPIPQRDYYQFLSFFMGLNRFGVRSPDSIFEASLRPISKDADVQKYKDEIQQHQARQRKVRDQLATIEAQVLPKLTNFEKDEFQDEVKRANIFKKYLPESDHQRYISLRRELRRLDDFRPTGLEMALCATEIGRTARDTHILLRGNPHVEGDRVDPGFPSVLNPPTPEITAISGGDTCGRRLALAKWIASPTNPLTARVLVNRVWQYHFGRGIVRTPNNFGFQGSKPTHPELLDWLASVFVRSENENSPASSHSAHSSHSYACGWSLKKLHRLILLSNTYQQSSASNPKSAAKDPENDEMWRYDMRRLEAEEVRDSILAVNGSLNPQMGGPSIYTEMPAEVLASQSMPGAGWGKSSPEQQCRRSVYIHVKRSLVVPILASFDVPETDFTCPVRFATTQPTQALGLMNSDFVNKQAKVFAEYLQKHAADPTAQVKLALDRVLQHPPSATEIQRGISLINRLQSQGKSPIDALRHFCVVALNLNEFLYIE